MEDIAPELLEKIRRSFVANLRDFENIEEFDAIFESGAVTYANAYDYAERVAWALESAFREHLSSSVLPDGRMYYNIAERVVKPLLQEDSAMIAKAAEAVQQALNRKAGLGLRAQSAGSTAERIDGIVDAVSSAEYDQVMEMFLQAVQTFSLAVVDRTIQANAEFHAKVGLHPKIVRKASRGCCPWCRALAGTHEYIYPDPDGLMGDVFRRHENCRCLVEYDPSDGSRKRQNVHSKTWR